MDLLCCNLPEAATEDSIRRIFSEHGIVSAVNFEAGYDRIHGTWHAHAYVTMKNDREATLALRALNGAPWCGRRLCIGTTYRCPEAVLSAQPT
jgi:RNA recognition motif-containing protein